MHWDLFCSVIDNHGDLGVCWRLAADLAARGARVRLWTDDASALGWMAPRGAVGVEARSFGDPSCEPGDVVIEAFGCDPPVSFVARMQRARPPVWINLEYLSAESYVERSHGLASPQQVGPGVGLRKWFYYPGFTGRTGGLIREPGLADRRFTFDRLQWLAGLGLTPRPDERLVSLFCYANETLPQLLNAMSATPTLLLAAAGQAAEQVRASLGPTLRMGQLRAALLPTLSQNDFDRLLWACELNFVRGEDSFVRAQWAGAPFVWQAYVQHDGVHEGKVDAFLNLFLDAAVPSVANSIRALWRAWNGYGEWPGQWPDASAWSTHTEHWCTQQFELPDLVTRLLAFVATKA